MAWCGTKSGVTSLAPVYQIVYWCVFLLLLLLALYMALLDLRYIRMLYSEGEKDLFEDTLGSEEFRRALRDAHAQTRDQERGDQGD
jgi:hypothetical protein